ncbi:magnesium-translocating P-type ATPase [Microbacterium luticocti]|uniref:magnesium-translocating P-type ATPase n=1 Tax=Microbacterium luticocti TaxID=451764 RepID=UPI001B7FA326|nr:magnesium-translocating P-type ATPase [Microbacterium luticocti]
MPTAAYLSTYWSTPVDDLAVSLSSGPGGLSAAAAQAALPTTRARAVSTRRRTGSWRMLAHQFTSPIILILVAATVLSGVLGDGTDAIIILVIVLLSGLLDFVQERGAAGAMDELLGTVRLTATALRGGARTEVPFDEVVPGDVIVVAGGDILPADAVVLTATGLEADQSTLTGETFPVPKAPGVSPAGAPLAARSNVLYSGTHIASGSGTALVVATGRDTEFGRVMQSMRAKPRPTGFERGMTRFGLLLTRVMVVLVVAIFAFNLVVPRPIVDSALFSLSLAVGLTPQLLPAIVGISLAQGARTIARHRVIVKRLNAIEDFGAMTVLCTDKTGTMTQGHIRLSGSLAIDGTPSPAVLRTASWNAGLQQGLSNPMDAAIIAAAKAAGIDPAEASALGELPYDFDRKRLSVLVDSPDGRVLVTKGAVGPVLDVCTHARAADGAQTPIGDARPGVEQVVDALGAQGMRVLAVATRPLMAGTCTPADESGLTLIGLLTFADPVKPEAAATIPDFAAAGVAVRMITGDARPVAAHIAGELGLDPSAILTGGQIDALDDDAFARAAASAHIFCETSPHHKERIIRALSRAGETVGYLGDGINDAPALKAADVGISVTGAADVAAESAAIVMLANDLRSLLDGMRQGRRTFANTMKYIFMTTSANFGNMISMAIASIVLPFLPLLAAQILMINLLTDLPATAIATDNVDARQLARPQRWNMRLIRNYMIVFGLVSSVFDIVTFIVLRAGFGAGEHEFQSAWFLGSVLTEVFVLFVLRTRGPSWRSRPGGTLTLLSVLVVIVTFAIVLTPVGGPLRLTVPPASLVALVVLIAIAYCAATELTKVVFWRVPAHAHPVRPGKDVASARPHP